MAKFVTEFSKSSTKLLKQFIEEVGVIVTGRRTFENAGAWDGQNPFNRFGLNSPLLAALPFTVG